MIDKYKLRNLLILSAFMLNAKAVFESELFEYDASSKQIRLKEISLPIGKPLAEASSLKIEAEDKALVEEHAVEEEVEENIKLRSFVKADEPDFQALFQNEEAVKYFLNGKREDDEARSKRWIASQTTPFQPIVVTIDNQIKGCAMLIPSECISNTVEQKEVYFPDTQQKLIEVVMQFMVGRFVQEIRRIGFGNWAKTSEDREIAQSFLVFKTFNRRALAIIRKTIPLKDICFLKAIENCGFTADPLLNYYYPILNTISIDSIKSDELCKTFKELIMGRGYHIMISDKEYTISRVSDNDFRLHFEKKI